MVDNLQEVRIDVELLKKDVGNITSLCHKMDAVIEKMVEQQDRYLSQIYSDMDKREDEMNADVKELHSRITTISRDLGDKIELTERRLLDELKDLRKQITDHNNKEDSELKKITNWKWMIAGGVVVLSWVISNVNLNVLSTLVKG